MIVILGLCLIFIPPMVLIGYIITKGRKKHRFDKYIEYLKKHNDKKGIILAYAHKIIVGITIMLLGFYMSEDLENEVALKYLIIFTILTIIITYFYKKNKR